MARNIPIKIATGYRFPVKIRKTAFVQTRVIMDT
jgi:hypothetical protein